tara:strand:- start:495 stop:737 length:243 start_codon:yes stop_codon:yes gene_type:complete
MIEWFPYFALVALCFVIVTLLAQLNRERQERTDTQKLYRELALRVRNAQLDVELHGPIDPMDHLRSHGPRRATVEDVEGV